MQLTIRLSNTVFGWNKTFPLVKGSGFTRDGDWGLSVKNKLKPLISSLRSQAPSGTSKLEKDCNVIETNAVKTNKALENSQGTYDYGHGPICLKAEQTNHKLIKNLTAVI